ncbi:MAG: flagellar basal-body MS-ring/collar protein FliF [bacterium]|nr:flagellar basal-body MS-ring/collar protein FliF [bacterium]
MASAFDPGAILGQFTANYLKLPLSQKLLFPIIIVGTIWGIVFVSNWAAKPDYVVLFSDLEAADASAVVERLKAQKIKYEIRGDGGTVAITPAEMVHELRITMASEGIPKGGKVGYELFDTSSFGTTGFVERLKFVRATQGELERTISSIDSVASARVHITQPEKTVFAKKSSEPTASVLLKLRAGGELDAKQIKGIAHLVAGSVESLKVENVNIVDVFGNLLSDKIQSKDDEIGGDSDRIQYQHQIERGYVDRIEQMLSKILGAGKVIARVTTELDFSQNEREEESYDPGGQVARSERSIEEGIGSNSKGGIPGVVSNLTDAQAQQNPESESQNLRRKESVKNFEVSRAVSKTSSPRGNLTKLSVAVLVDGTYDIIPAAKEGEEATKIYKTLPPETIQKIEDVVRSAVGFDPGRGDTLTVENIPFYVEQDAFAHELDSKATQDFIFNVVSKVVPGLFIILFFLIVVRPLVRFMVTPTEAEIDLSRLLPTGIEELEQELKQERKAVVPVDTPASVDIAQLEALMAENSKVVKENPGQAALLIKYWLNDGRAA